MSEPNHHEAALLPLETITLRITVLRGQRVIMDSDLAALYAVPTKRFNEAVKRNLAKFPPDFMFTLTEEEFAALRSQSATSNAGPVGRGGRRYAPRVFTEHGALMAATILSSPRAIEISVYVVRAFIRLRELATQHADLATRLSELEEKTEALALNHDTFSRNTRNQLKQVFDALRELMTPPEPPTPPKQPIGFIRHEDKGNKASSVKKRK
ncbi:MAG: ORF6N domain-containing protein [Rhizobacter sp.]